MYHVNRKANSFIERYKARFVAKGFSKKSKEEITFQGDICFRNKVHYVLNGVRAGCPTPVQDGTSGR